MATYKVWLTVKDSYGNIKEIDSGNIKINMDKLSDEDLDQIKQAVPLDDYLKKSDIDTELDHYATDQEVADKNTFKYSSFFDATSNGGTE